MYEGIAAHTAYQLTWPTVILGGIGVCLAIPVYVFYWKGAWFRTRSKYAMQLEAERAEERAQGDAPGGEV